MSKREETKAIEDTQIVAEEAKNIKDKHSAVKTLQIGQQQAVTQEFQSTVNRSLDETKENVRKSIDEARNQIPQYANVVKNYQEQALESTGKIAEEHIEAQKSVIDSAVSSSAPYYENANRMFNYWYSLRVPVEIWARAVSNIAENVSASVRIGNDILFGNIEAFGNAFERVQRQTEELSRINVDNAKTIVNTAEETAAELSDNEKREVFA
jgi:predicted S18 family serine protease